ncbi:alpha/beta hydrolase [Olivibacter sp. SDN3]|uniref:alpha/beta fold hydrolase n=1 Tax=Olivibacter sp. SDN3 TaxID=2764720 RepID=UPI0016518C53|nr:alpha/beta hydrolase [Olivibacter sp. SDN3]QNL48044.1 alpha/beta hydrolase [Olivibacter sp. SDN3]
MEYLSIRGSKYFYEDMNRHHQEVILLIHGHPFDDTMWDYQLDALKDYRLILPDPRGYGKTVRDAGKNIHRGAGIGLCRFLFYSIAELASYIRTVLFILKPFRIIVFCRDS